MSRYLLDTDHVSLHERGHPPLLARLAAIVVEVIMWRLNGSPAFSAMASASPSSALDNRVANFNVYLADPSGNR
jgi:hypothetical protein